MSGAAFWPGDPMYGTNPYTGEIVRGSLVTLDTSPLDGMVYATLRLADGGETVIPATALRGPGRCTRPTARDPWDDTCARCGRAIYPNGPYDSERLTHFEARRASRYR